MDISVTDYRQLNEDYLRIEQAILYLEKNAQRQPELEEIAGSIGLSEFHFQRLFTRWAGISPKRFLQFMTRQNAKEMLDRSENILDTTLQVGLSSLGRLHDGGSYSGRIQEPRCRTDHTLWPASNTLW